MTDLDLFDLAMALMILPWIAFYGYASYLGLRWVGRKLSR